MPAVHPSPPDVLDSLIVGAGPAGLTAAIYLARFRRRLLVADAGSSRATLIGRSYNHPGYPNGVSGRELLQNMRLQAERYGARLIAAKVERLERQGQDFAAFWNGGAVSARSVVLATGVIDRQPPLPDALHAVRSQVLRYCPVCDGYELIGRRVAVLGHSASAVGEALFMRTYTHDITVLTLGQPLENEARSRAVDSSLPVIEAGLVKLVEDGQRAIAVLDDGRTLQFDALYGALGCTARSHLGVLLGAAIGADERFLTDEHQQTTVPNLYAAGDVVRGLNQISVAMGEAAIAATAIHNRLSSKPRA